MRKLAVNTQTHRYCKRCDTVKLLTDFAPSSALTLGRNYTCRVCSADYQRARRERMAKGEAQRKERPNDPTPMPAMDLLQKLECVRFNKWKYPVSGQLVGWSIK